MAKTVLLIDDSESERAIVTARLERAGYRVASAQNGRDGLRQLFERRPDIVLLDVVMPDLDGWRALEMIRDVSDVPVIMLTARDSEIERVRGLRAGADDYVGKPFSASELNARIDAVLRRGGGRAAASETYDDGVVRIDFSAAEVRVRGDVVALTPLEFRLLSVLTAHANQVLSRDQLLEHVWGDTSDVGGDQVKVYVGYLRRKIERDPAAPELLENVRGFGYRYRRP